MAQKTKAIEKVSTAKNDGKCYYVSSLYIEAKTKKYLLMTETYNYDSLPGEEFLISVSLVTNNVTQRPPHRVVIVSGEGEHIPIYRSRVHVVGATGSTGFSGMHHPPSPMARSTLGSRSVTVVRVKRGMFVYNDQRTYESLKDDMELLKLPFIEKKSKESTGKKNKAGALPSVSAVVPISNPAVKTTSHGIDIESWVDDSLSVASNRPGGSGVTTTASRSKEALFPYKNVIDALTRHFKKSPVSVSPEDHSWTMVTADAAEIHAKALSCDGNLPNLRKGEYPLTQLKSSRPEYILVFNDPSLSSCTLYEGKREGQMTTCPNTGFRFCLRSIE